MYFTKSDIVSHIVPAMAGNDIILRQHTIVASWIDVIPE